MSTINILFDRESGLWWADDEKGFLESPDIAKAEREEGCRFNLLATIEQAANRMTLYSLARSDSGNGTVFFRRILAVRPFYGGESNFDPEKPGRSMWLGGKYWGDRDEGRAGSANALRGLADEIAWVQDIALEEFPAASSSFEPSWMGAIEPPTRRRNHRRRQR